MYFASGLYMVWIWIDRLQLLSILKDYGNWTLESKNNCAWCTLVV